MAVIESWVRCDLKKPVQVQMLGGNLFSMDNQGNKIGVEVFDNGAAASISGTVSGNVIRADGTTVAVSGTLSGNKASIVLPQAAYAVPGFVTIVIKLTASSVITTLAAVTGIVYRSSTDTAVDPGTIIPDINTLIAQIDAAVASIPADYSSLWASLAPTFNSGTSYAVGQYVLYNGGLYRFKKAHSGSWSSSDVVSETLGEGVSKNENGILGATCPTSFTGTFSSTGQTLDTSIVLVKGVSYAVRVSIADSSKSINIFSKADYNNYVNLTNGEVKVLTPAITDIMAVFNRNSSSYTGSVTVSVQPVSIAGSVHSNVQMISSASRLSDITHGTYSLDDFPVNTIQMLGSTNIGLLNKPEGFSEIGTVMTYSYTPYTTDTSIVQQYTDRVGKIAIRYKYNASTEWTGWNTITNTAHIQFSFGSSDTTLTSSYNFTAGKKYYLKTNIASDIFTPRNFNVFVTGNSNFYVRVFDCWTVFIPEDTGNMRVGNVTGYEGKMTLDIMEESRENDAIYNTPKKYYVDVTGVNSSITSLTDLLLGFVKRYNQNLQNDSLGFNLDESPKEIYLYPGTYNVFNEYLTEIAKGSSSRLNALADIPDNIGTTSYFGKYNAFIPPNTKLIGLGNVTLQFTPTTSQINYGASLTWSPVNIFGSCDIENIRIVCKNCRYGIHDDPGTDKFIRARHIFRNVTIDYTEGDVVNGNTYGRNNTTGFGFAPQSTYIFENCELIYNGNNARGMFYGHDDGIEGATLILSNCVFRSSKTNEDRAVRLQTIKSTSSTPGHYTVKISNCVIKNGIWYDYESDKRNAFDVTLIHSGNPPISYRSGVDPSTNPYLPAIYE